MIDKSSLLKSKGSLYLEFIPKDGLFHKMLLLSLMGFLTGWCNPQERAQRHMARTGRAPNVTIRAERESTPKLAPSLHIPNLT